MMVSSWRRWKQTANSGSTPEEAPAMIEMVPVGAMVVTVALRWGRAPFLSKMEPLKLGKAPRCCPVRGKRRGLPR